jgi:hypothetical protein
MGKCKITECVAPVSCHVHGGTDFEKCENFVSDGVKNDAPSKTTKESKSNLPWTGDFLGTGDLNSVSARNSPVLLSVVGRADAGKTSFLGMVYTLLLNGKTLRDFKFAGSYSLIGWDELHFNLTLNKGKVSFADPTPVGVNRLYHLALKGTDDRLHDILFSDASGETFAYWSQNKDDENGANAKWVHKNSDGFILFVDCDALVENLSVAKNEILDIGQQLSSELGSRPVVVVWSKADKFSQVNPKIVESIKERLPSLFTNFKEIEISNLLGATPDELVQKNNLDVVNWLLDKILVKQRLVLDPVANLASSDFFINYR